MPAEDRDRLFENALARHLRADAAAADHSACLDTELLAAYHERMLSPEEIIIAKNHLVSCARCQEILVQLEATQNLQDAQNNEADLIVTRPSSRSKSGAVVEQAASAPASVPIIQKPLDKITPFHARKSLLLRWAAPAGAIAAGLLLWIGVREFRRPPKFEGKPTEIAQNRAQSSQSIVPAPATLEPREKQKTDFQAREEFKEQQIAPPSSPLGNGQEDSRLTTRPLAPPNADKKAPAPAPMAKPKGALTQAPSRASGPGAGSAAVVGGAELVEATPDTSALDSVKTESNVQANKTMSQLSAGARPAAPPPPPAPNAAKSRQERVITSEAAAPTPLTKDVNQAEVPARVTYNLVSLSSSVASPNGKSLWRFGPSGTIAHSSDAGQTWKPQVSGVTATLTNGSAPSDEVCWIVGAAGTLLFTKDAGKHWQVVATPIAGDLGGVHATDAKHASIWDLPNHLSYQTLDGGTTWKPSGSE